MDFVESGLWWTELVMTYGNINRIMVKGEESIALTQNLYIS